MFRLLRKLWTQAQREHGSSYSLPLVVVLPFYVLLVLAIFELGFLLIARVGVGYAAHAAARAAAVWEWADPNGAHPRLAAWAALAPFAGAGEGELAAAGPVPAEARAASPDYAALYRTGEDGPTTAGLQRKFENAAARTTVDVETISAPGGPKVQATVTYRAPVRVPVFARFLNGSDSGTFDVSLTATATMPAARPATASGTLGIPFPVPAPPGGAP